MEGTDQTANSDRIVISRQVHQHVYITHVEAFTH